MRTALATSAAFAIVAVCIMAVACFVPEEQVPKAMWLFIFLIIVLSGLYFWNHPQSPTNAAGWLSYIGFAIVIGVILVAIDVIVQILTFTDGSLMQSIVNGLCTSGYSCCAMGGVIITIAGWVRSLLLGEE